MVALGLLPWTIGDVPAEQGGGAPRARRLPPISATEHQREVVGSSRRIARLPPTTAPENELQINLPSTPTRAISQPLRAGEWEHLDAIEPETLADAWAQALAVDPWLDSKRISVAASEATARAANAESYPWLDVGASYTVRDNQPGFVFSAPPYIPDNTVFPNAQREGAGYFAAVTVPIYTGGSVPAAIDSASANVAATEIDAQVAQLDLKIRVAEEYVHVLRASSELDLANTTVRSLTAHARDVEMLFKHEQRPKNDLLAAQVALADARYAAITASNQLDRARATYNRRLARPLTTPVHLHDLPVDRAESDLDVLTAVALENRGELSQMAWQAVALEQQAESILARNRPQAAVTGGYTFNENQYQSPQGITSVGLGVTWNLYDAGRDKHRACALQQQAAVIHRLRADLESRIRLDLRRAWLDVEETTRRLAVTHEALAQAEENVRVARGRYGNDMGTNTDVLAAESLRVQSFRNHHHAYYDAVIARLRLQRAAGDL
ncbi:MAG TPA: TolC family protein [Pirellulaceae bacterium]|nr:TolC family protein [Pirellulaceae bacterium]